MTRGPQEARGRTALLWGLAALVQIALLMLPLGERLIVHATGTEVTLALRPVDPRDLLRGDYVILNPDIARIDAALAEGVADLDVGDEVWTVVTPDEAGVFRPVAVRATAPEDGRVALKGRIEGRAADALSIDYGLTAFFVPQGRGLEIERLPQDEVQLVVAVTQDGRSAPLRLLHQGRVLLRETAF